MAPGLLVRACASLQTQEWVKNAHSGDGMNSLSSVHFKLQQTLNPHEAKLPGGCAEPGSLEESGGGQCEDMECTPEPCTAGGNHTALTIQGKNDPQLIKTCMAFGEAG